MTDDVQVISVTVEPDTQAMQDKKIEEKNIGDIAMSIKDTINSFSGEVLTEDKEKKSKGFIDDFTSFIQSDNFRDTINANAKRLGIPPKQLAKNFFMKVLGVAGDVLGIAISTVGDVANTLVTVISTILHSGVDLICRFANGLARIVTLNQTATA